MNVEDMIIAGAVRDIHKIGDFTMSIADMVHRYLKHCLTPYSPLILFERAEIYFEIRLSSNGVGQVRIKRIDDTLEITITEKNEGELIKPPLISTTKLNTLLTENNPEDSLTIHVEPQQQHNHPQIQNRKYEASFYYMRNFRALFPNLPPEHDDVFYSTRLHDITFKMPGIAEAIRYAKESIRNPGSSLEGAWKQVLDNYFIPHKVLEWEESLMELAPNDENPFYRCESKPFKDKNGDKWIIRIRIFPEKKEQAPPGEY